jgi:peptidoglycan pentaglycine glycine transferase (the first glycine)
MQNEIEKLIQDNSPDGGFLQSEEWRKFQESVGRKTFCVSWKNFHSSIIEHKLPIVGKYFYIPRGPIMSDGMQELVDLAKKEKAGWIRFDANDSRMPEEFCKNWRVSKSPHDMQPREIFVIDISKSEDELLAEMKSKTRYNINLAIRNSELSIRQSKEEKDIEEFLRLTGVMAKRQKIATHPDEYYRKMFETIPEKILKLYVAEYENQIVAANLVVFYGKTATYLHGASDDKFRNLMAPHFLQWRQIQDARKEGCERYDLGGISESGEEKNKWSGITRFKLGFSPKTEPVKFPGTYDIVINEKKYALYRFIQRIKSRLKI